MAEGVRIERDGAIQILRFDRLDKKNAITSAMYDAMADALEATNGDPGIGVCVFLGAPGVFTAGNDLGDFMRAAPGGQGLAAILRFLRALATCDRPVFAGVDGLAVGIGATLLLHCDYVLATERTVLRTPFTSLGLVPEAASSLLGPRMLGHARAFELLVMGRDMDGATACRCGIVNGICEPERLEAEILAAARELAAKPRQAVLASRRLLKGGPAEILARIDAEAEEFATRLASPEAQAAFAAFLSETRR